MRSILFHIPATLFGLPMFGLGLLLAVWAVLSLVLLAWLIRRQGLSSDTLGYVPLLLVIGALVYWVLPSLCDSEGLPIRSYGMMMLLGILTGTALAIRRARPLGLDSDSVVTLVFWIVVPGIVGARMFYVIEYCASSGCFGPTARSTCRKRSSASSTWPRAVWSSTDRSSGGWSVSSGSAGSGGFRSWPWSTWWRRA